MTTTNAFAALGLSEGLVAALTKMGFEEPTPIQKAAIPVLLKGRDVLGQAATGTGKTAAFALPLIERYVIGHKPGIPSVLVLTPTRELCLQVAESFVSFGSDVGIQVAPIYGGQEYGRQIRLLKRGVHVVVATPGRALDHIHRGTLDVSGVEAFVLDEADEMLDMGFADELDAILAELPTERQTALFSATMPERIRSIEEAHLHNPEHIIITAEKPTAGDTPRVPQIAYIVGRPYRLAVLGRILDIESPQLAIVFARTRLEVEEVAEGLRSRGFSVEPLHGGMDQPARDRVMRRAKAGDVDVIVATDVAARGIDLDNVSHVINYGIPASLETYVHRIGRTGRAGRSGLAITILEPREHRQLRLLERMTKAKIEVRSVPSLTDVRAKRLELTRAAIEGILEENAFEKYRVVVEQLCEDHDAFEVAAAAIAYAEKLNGSHIDEEEIPSTPLFEKRKNAVRRPARDPEPGMQRLFIGAGRESGIRPSDIVGAIANEAHISSRAIGAIEIFDRFTLVEVDSNVAGSVISALKGTTIKGRNVVIRKDQPKRASKPRPPRSTAASRFDDEPAKKKTE